MSSVGAIMMQSLEYQQAWLTVSDLDEGPPAFERSITLSETPYPPESAIKLNRERIREGLLRPAAVELIDGEYPAVLSFEAERPALEGPVSVEIDTTLVIARPAVVLITGHGSVIAAVSSS